ncbi:cytochrome P450 [Aureobasidium pullulans]|nr:cytochrome P450 [Aureobasidium pullulans]
MFLSNYTFSALAVAAALYCLLEHWFGIFHEETEPPILPSKIPWFGHLLGIMQHRTQYMLRLRYRNIIISHGCTLTIHRKRSTLPIYSLPMPAGKLYVVNTPHLITSVMKNSKTLLFGPFATKNHRRLFGVSAEAERLAQDNVDLARGPWGLWHEAVNASHVALNPGEGLDELNRKMLQGMSRTFERLIRDTSEDPKEIGLLEWLKLELTNIVTAASYGPGNPFVDPKVGEAFWNFEENMMMVFAGIFPTVSCPKAYYGREKTIKALTAYFAAGKQHSAGHLVKGIHEHTAKYGLSHEDMARFELATVIAMLVNTLPSAFWLLYYIYKDEKLLKDLRTEVATIVRPKEFESGVVARTIPVADLKTKCPLLNSTWLEILRHHADGSSFREVTADTVLDQQYLLKKGNVVQMPAIVIHNDVSVWGPDAAQFDAYRFLADNDTKSDKSDATGEERRRQAKRQSVPGAFRAFGGGQTLCPGRHFVTTELLSLTAMMIMRFDITYGSGKIEWPKLGWNDKDMSAAITHPASDIKVTVSQRPSARGLWTFETSQVQGYLSSDSASL